MTILLLRGYNNYFNRIKKSEATITEYKTASTSYLEYGNVNFDYQDGILTSLVVGNEQQQITIPPTTEGANPTYKILDFESGDSPDYLVVHDNINIKSRWFVVECVKIRGGQYKLALKRDVLVDFDIKIMNSPCFVEKGFINNVNDPLLLNSEGMSFNQIKQDEFSIRDETNCAWLVGYLHKDLDSTKLSNVNPITYTISSPTGQIKDAGEYAWESCITYRNADNTTTAASKVASFPNNSASMTQFRTYWPDKSGSRNIRTTIYLDGNSINTSNVGHYDFWGLDSCALDIEHHPGDGNFTYPAAERVGKNIIDHTLNWEYVNSYYNNLITAAKYEITQGNNLVGVTEDLTKYNGQTVMKNNKVYKLTVGQGSEVVYEKYYTGNDTICNDYLSSLYYDIGDGWGLYRNQDNPSRNKVKITLAYRQYSIIADEIVVGNTATYNLPVSANRNQCSDALYDMFCMPIDPSVLGLEVKPTNAELRYRPDAQSSFQYAKLNSEFSLYQLGIATKLATKLGAGQDGSLIYDLQLLPYCPMDNLSISYNSFYDETTINVSFNYLDAKDGTVILDGNSKLAGVIFYPKRANFTKDVTLSMSNTHVETQTKLIKNPVFDYSGSDEDGYYWYWSRQSFEIGTPAEELSQMTLDTSNIQYYLPGAYAYGGWMVSGNYLYFGLDQSLVDTPASTLSFNGTVTLTGKWIVEDGPIEKKVNNECDFYRLTSPNYNGMFEFKKTKLNNGITTVNIDCTYKPISPYIKLNPNLFDSLYSNKDYNDSTGLICAGDFSLPMLSDAMINYELQNRNYQSIFNRQLQNLDVNQRIAKEQQQFAGMVGAIGAPITGGLAGAATGAKAGPYGAIAGAVIGAAGGGILGGVGYAKDQEWLKEQQYEARDFMVDQFQYKLGNIQALPQSVTKSSPLSFNNKVWPILEYYSCKDREKEILRSKIRYDGMTIMAIGTLQEYATAGGYLKGKMIRLNGLNDDSHIANAIYEEVAKGFYEGE